MHWIAPSEKDVANDTLEKRLWAAADQLRANSGLTSQQYSQPVLGLIFLRFAEVRFDKRRAELEKAGASGRRASRIDDPTAYHAEGVIYLSVKARFATLLNLPEGADVGKAVNDAMADIEKQNPQLAGVLPRTDNANYLWIQLFYSALRDPSTSSGRGGRAGFVMANSAADARSSELEIRKQLIQAPAADVVVAVGPNMFYTVTLPCTLWFFDKGKVGRGVPTAPSAVGRVTARGDAGNAVTGDAAYKNRSDTILFIDARHIYRQIGRAHRDWTPAQIGFLGNLVRLYRGETLDFTLGGDEAKAKLQEVFCRATAPVAKSGKTTAKTTAGRACPTKPGLPRHPRPLPCRHAGGNRSPRLVAQSGPVCRRRARRRSQRRGFQRTTRSPERGTGNFERPSPAT